MGSGNRGSSRPASLEASGCNTHKAGSLQVPQQPQTRAMPFPSLTWPLMSGFAPMAVCSSFTSLVGPVMSEVPVSTMASQPPLHRVSPLATSTLGRDAQRGDNILQMSQHELQQKKS